MPRPSHLMLITTVILLTGLLLALAATPSQNKATAATVTRQVPDFTLPVVDVNGLTNRTFTLSSLNGRPVLIEFVFEWCPHCNNMAPLVERLHQAYGDRVVLITVAGGYRSSYDKTVEYVRKHNITWTVVYNDSMEVFDKYSVRGTPTYIAVSPSGAVVGRLEGEQAYTAVEQLVKAALAG